MHTDEHHDRNCICWRVPTTQGQSIGYLRVGRGRNSTLLCQISSGAAVEATLPTVSRQKFQESVKKGKVLRASFLLQMTGVVCAYRLLYPFAHLFLNLFDRVEFVVGFVQ